MKPHDIAYPWWPSKRAAEWSQAFDIPPWFKCLRCGAMSSATLDGSCTGAVLYNEERE